MLVLGIETSCDETAAAIVKDGRDILSNVVLSSLRFHKPYGGIVPEIACRHHTEIIDSVIKEAFLRANCKINQIDLIAVTNGPGLIGALLVGVSTAKGLALSNNIPVVGVNHIWAHLYAPFMNIARSKDVRIKFPYVGLVISGGHTSLMFVEDFDRYQNLGQTTDDAAGEAFDKVAKILKLGIPGGPVIERLAKHGDANAIKFPKSLLNSIDNLDFSFSGIKTAVLYYVGKIENKKKIKSEISNICASFQKSVIDVIVEKSIKACQKKEATRLVVGGGVSINSMLRRRLQEACVNFGISIYFPSKGLCLDNASMVAGLGYHLYKKSNRDNLRLNAFANIWR